LLACDSTATTGSEFDDFLTLHNCAS
jgi:hypothetical protein